jgi:K+-transporting ATPase ATPase C chain
MKSYIFSSIRLTFILAIIFIGGYSLVILGIAQLSPNKGKGEIITQNGRTYYTNIGQKFTDDKYFWSRPSAVDYNASGSAGSNKAPSNPDYLKEVKKRVDYFLVHNPEIKKSEIPSEMVTASGSGLDPDISVASADIQIKRISKIRNIPEANLKQLILSNKEKPLLGLFGPEKINVLKLNLALDQLK